MNKSKPKFKMGDKVLIVGMKDFYIRGAFIATTATTQKCVDGTSFDFYGVVWLDNVDIEYNKIDLFIADEHIVPFNKYQLKIAHLLYGK